MTLHNIFVDAFLPIHFCSIYLFKKWYFHCQMPLSATFLLCINVMLPFHSRKIYLLNARNSIFVITYFWTINEFQTLERLLGLCKKKFSVPPTIKTLYFLADKRIKPCVVVEISQCRSICLNIDTVYRDLLWVSG